MKVTIKTAGLGVLTARLQDMPVKVSARFIKAAGRAAMAPVLRDAKANVPVDEGDLRDALRIVSRSRRAGDVPLEVGVTVRRFVRKEDIDGQTVKTKINAAWRWHFIETGAPGRGLPARPFLRPAFDANKALVLERFRDQLKKRIEKFDATSGGQGSA